MSLGFIRQHLLKISLMLSPSSNYQAQIKTLSGSIYLPGVHEIKTRAIKTIISGGQPAPDSVFLQSRQPYFYK